MEKSIKKNYVYNLVFQLLTLILPFLTIPYLSRVLGVANIGISSYTLSIVSYFILFGSVGVASYGQREVAMHRNDKDKCSKIFWELFLYKTIICFISLIGFVILILLSKNYQIIYIILILNLLSAMLDITWFFQGLEEYKFISIRNIVIKLISVVCIFLFVKDTSDFNLYILISSLSLIIGSLSLWTKLPKYVNKIELNELKIFSHSKNTLIYFMPQIATQVYTMLDKSMIKWITGSEVQNGYYEQAYRIATISLTIITALSTVIAPRIAYLYANNKHQEIKERLTKSINYVILLGLPITIGMISITNNFITWFLSSEFDYVKVLLPIFSPLVLIIGLSNCLGSQCLTPCGRRFKSAVALWIGAIINFILNLFLINIWGCLGAVISSVIAELIITITYFYLSKDYIDCKEIFKLSLKYILSSTIMGIVLFIINFPLGIVYTFLEIIIGIIIYFGILLLLKDKLFIELINVVIKRFKR